MIHPFDEPRFARRLGTLRTLCQAMIVGLAGISGGVGMIVYYALDGQPLAGQRFTVNGISIMTVISGLITLIVPFIVLWAGRKRSSKAAELAPEDVEGRLTVFAGVTFTEYAIPLGVGFTWAVMFHITSDPLMLIWIGILLLLMILRYPSLSRAKHWYDQLNRGANSL